jgi:hypothetical protein
VSDKIHYVKYGGRGFFPDIAREFTHYYKVQLPRAEIPRIAAPCSDTPKSAVVLAAAGLAPGALDLPMCDSQRVVVFPALEDRSAVAPPSVLFGRR